MEKAEGQRFHRMLCNKLNNTTTEIKKHAILYFKFTGSRLGTNVKKEL